jgi:DNA modification methylase
MTVKILIGDCRDVLKTLPDESVHCVVTSPPYWGLRDYGVEGQLGMERSLGEHVESMVQVFREVRRVLRMDGTLWLNYGDSYAASVNGRSAADTKTLGQDDRTFRDKPFSTIGPISRVGQSNNKGNTAGDNLFRIAADGFLKPKDLCGIPWRVAFALQADGWYLRQDIIWSKPNPMPESVTDRCTKAHEYIFLLSKSARYYYDAEAIVEKFVDDRNGNPGAYNWKQGSGGVAGGGVNSLHKENGRVEGWNIDGAKAGRNKRSVWTVATQPFSEAHFATFPPALIEPCVMAGTSEKGCCAKCGAPHERQTDVTRRATRPGNESKFGGLENDIRASGSGNVAFGLAKRTEATVTTIGWFPSCQCAEETKPCVVLDPFGGAGTTGMVADRLQRNAILIELNPQYAEMAKDRIKGDAPLFSPEHIAENGSLSLRLETLKNLNIIAKYDDSQLILPL